MGTESASTSSPHKLYLALCTLDEGFDARSSEPKQAEFSRVEETFEHVREAALEYEDSISFYLREVGKFKLLSPAEEKEIAKAAYEGDEEARVKMILHNLRLVIAIAKGYRRRTPLLDFSDLIEEGNIGLMTAVDKFEYWRGFKFSTYPTWWIRQRIARACQDNSDIVRVPVHMQEPYYKITVASEKLIQQLGRDPKPEEIALASGIDLAIVKRSLRQMKMKTMYLEDLAGANGEGEEYDVLERITSNRYLTPEQMTQAKEALADLCEQVKDLLALISPLPKRTQDIFRMRYGLDGTLVESTLEEIGAIHRITRERVRQIEAKGWETLGQQGFRKYDSWIHHTMNHIRELADITNTPWESIKFEPETGRIVKHFPTAEPPKKVLVPVVEEPFEQIAPPPLAPVPTEEEVVDAILIAVCDAFDVDPEALFAKRRIPAVTEARKSAAFLLRWDLKMPFPQVAEVLYVSENTAIQYFHEIKRNLQHDRWLARRVGQARKLYGKNVPEGNA